MLGSRCGRSGGTVVETGYAVVSVLCRKASSSREVRLDNFGPDFAILSDGLEKDLVLVILSVGGAMRRGMWGNSQILDPMPSCQWSDLECRTNVSNIGRCSSSGPWH